MSSPFGPDSSSPNPFSGPSSTPFQPQQSQPPNSQPPYHQPGYQQSGHQQPGYQQQPFPQQPNQGPAGYQQYGTPQFAIAAPTNGLAVASMILGIVGIFMFCLLAIPCILAVIFGAVALKQIGQQGQAYAPSGRGMATAGLILGIIGLALFVLLLANGNWEGSLR